MDDRLKVWHKLISTHDIRNQNDNAIVKSTLRHNYIYCFPWNITIASGIYPCPVQVFRLPLNYGFKTKGEEFHPVIRSLTIHQRGYSYLDDVPSTHFQRDTLAANDNVFIDRIQQLQVELNQLKEEEPHIMRVNRYGFAWWSTIITMIILVLIVIALTIFIAIKIKKGHKSIKTDIRELKSEYEATSCMNCRSRRALALQPMPLSNRTTSESTSFTINRKKPEKPGKTTPLISSSCSERIDTLAQPCK